MRVLSMAIILSLASTVAEGRRDGAPAKHNGSVGSMGLNCTQCHFGGSGRGNVEVLGSPEQYEADVLYSLIVRISDPDQFGAGFQISAERTDGTRAGDLVLVDPLLTRFADGEPQWVTHTFDGVQDAVSRWAQMGSAAEYRVDWKSPSADVGPVTFFAAGNAINNDFSTGGDQVYLSSVTSLFKGGGVNCGDVKKLSAKCKRATITVKIASSLSGGTDLTLVLNGGATQIVTTKSNGKAKGKFKNVATGIHQVCILECPDVCRDADCR